MPLLHKTLPAACHECDLTVRLDHLVEGQKADCPRCGYTITRKFANAGRDMAVFSVTAVIALLFANAFTFIGLSAQGQEHSLTLVQSIHVLFTSGHWTLGVIILMTILVLPLLFARLCEPATASPNTRPLCNRTQSRVFPARSL